jgi:hypothetical protein
MATVQTLDDSEIGLSNALHHFRRLADCSKAAIGSPDFYAALEPGDDVTNLKKARAALCA